MANKIENNSNNHNFFKMIINNFFEKIIKHEIFITDELDTDASSKSKSFSQMDHDEKEKILKTLEAISIYNQDFTFLLSKYLSNLSTNINLKNFRNFIVTESSGIYLKKAIFLLIIKILLILTQFIFSIFFKSQKYICIETPTDDKDKFFWFYKGKKFKVKKDEDDYEIHLRIAIFAIDFIFIIFESLVLYNLKRIKSHISLIIFIQSIKFILYSFLIFPDLFKDNLCENSIKDKNIFYIKNTLREKISIISDIIKFIIN